MMKKYKITDEQLEDILLMSVKMIKKEAKEIIYDNERSFKKQYDIENNSEKIYELERQIERLENKNKRLKSSQSQLDKAQEIYERIDKEIDLAYKQGYAAAYTEIHNKMSNNQTSSFDQPYNR